MLLPKLPILLHRQHLLRLRPTSLSKLTPLRLQPRWLNLQRLPEKLMEVAATEVVQAFQVFLRPRFLQQPARPSLTPIVELRRNHHFSLNLRWNLCPNRNPKRLHHQADALIDGDKAVRLQPCLRRCRRFQMPRRFRLPLILIPSPI